MHILRLPVCQDCLDSIEAIRVPQCVQCGERLLPEQLLRGDGRCRGCHEFQPAFERAVSSGEYAGALRDLLHLLKYHKVLPAAPELGGVLAVAIAQLGVSGEAPPLLVPVPLQASRRGERGFNRAELMVRAAAKQLPQRWEGAAGLRRQRATHSPVALTRDERIANVRDALRVNAPGDVKGRTVIVVDDVMTTGTTVAECAHLLQKAGTERVWAATAARTPNSAVLPEAADCVTQEVVEAVETAVSI